MCECIKSSRRTWEGDDCPTCRPALDLSKPVQTRDGRAVRILTENAMGPYPVIGLVRSSNAAQEQYEKPCSWTVAGQYLNSGPTGSDLCNVPEKIGGWANVYENKKSGLCRMRDLHLTKEHAINCRLPFFDEVCLGTIYITPTEIQK